jgi:hypothetical protein
MRHKIALAGLALCGLACLALIPTVRAGWGTNGCPPVGGFGMPMFQMPQFHLFAQPAAAEPPRLDVQAPARGRWVCGPGGCRFVPAAADGFRWEHPNPAQSWLYSGDVLVGSWDHTRNEFVSWKGNQWDTTPGQHAPIEPPIRQLDPTKHASKPNFGLTEEHLSKDQETYTHKGKAASKQKVYEAVGDGKNDPSKLTDDSKKKRLNLIHPDKAARDKFIKDFKTAAEYAPLRPAFLPWEGAPDDWSYECGFDGKARFVAQEPDGEVFHSQADEPLPIEALRKKVDGYDPKKDPDVRLGDGGLLGLPKIDLAKILGGLTPTHWLAIAGAVWFLFFRKPQGPAPAPAA